MGERNMKVYKFSKSVVDFLKKTNRTWPGRVYTKDLWKGVLDKERPMMFPVTLTYPEQLKRITDEVIKR